MRHTYSPGYPEYEQLYADFISLATRTSRRYQYVQSVFKKAPFIPFIQSKLLTATSKEERDALIALEARHIDRWKRLEDVIDKMTKNQYVGDRLIEKSLYAMIAKE